MIARTIEGAADILILCDHASNAVPPGIDLGIDAELLDNHIAVDIGAAAVSEAMAASLNATAILATASRLVIDLNRSPDSPGLVPQLSDGHVIPGNANVDRLERIARFHAPYHGTIAARIRQHRPAMIVSVHSFTPRLKLHDGADRPWEIGILYNRDPRAARIGIDRGRAMGIVTGDNEPYSGRVLNATMNRHAEANGIPYLGFEIRNNLITDGAGVERWAKTCSHLVSAVVDTLALGRVKRS